MKHLSLEHFVEVEQRPIELTVVVPVLNERDNVEPLLGRLSLALIGIEWEVVFVDDRSSDGTADFIETLARSDRRVRLIRRFGRRGLSSAVIEGFLSSVAPAVAVIDGDMQHDETILPRLYAAVAEDNNDLAVGTRYREGGSIGDWDDTRKRISRLATQLAAPITKASLSDPMSGFFAIRRSVVLEAAPYLSSVGYKVLLDLVASAPRRLAIAEVPYTFAKRIAGESKLDSAVVLEYVELVLDKLVGRWIPVKLLMFGAVGALGMGVHLLGLALLLTAGLVFAAAQAGAVIMAITCNYALNNQFTYRDRRLKGWRWFTGLASFALACGLGAIANVGVGSVIYDGGQNWWFAGIAGAVVGSVWNYVAASWLTWRKR